MITLLVTLIAILAVGVTLVGILGVTGLAFIVTFGDVILCIIVIRLILKLIKRKKK